MRFKRTLINGGLLPRYLPQVFLAGAYGTRYPFPSIYGREEVFVARVAVGTVTGTFGMVFWLARDTTFKGYLVRIPSRRVPVNRLAKILCPVFLFVTMGFVTLSGKFIPYNASNVKCFTGLRPVPSAIARLFTICGKGAVSGGVIIGIVNVRINDGCRLVPYTPRLPYYLRSSDIYFIQYSLTYNGTLVSIVNSVFAALAGATLSNGRFVMNIVLKAISAQCGRHSINFVVVLCVASNNMRVFIGMFLYNNFVKVVNMISGFLWPSFSKPGTYNYRLHVFSFLNIVHSTSVSLDGIETTMFASTRGNYSVERSGLSRG